MPQKRPCAFPGYPDARQHLDPPRNAALALCGVFDIFGIMPNPENLLPGGGGIARSGVAIGPATHPICKGTRKDGQPCNALAVKATGLCVVHGGLKGRPEHDARSAALGPALTAFTEAKNAAGGTVPQAVLDSPLWPPIPRDQVRTFQRRAEAIQAYLRRDEDDGAAWRALLAKHG